MSPAQSVPTAPATSAVERREQPFLYTWNRRLRHLQGVSLRNLNLKPPVARSRGRTIADDDYDYEIITASKALLRREGKSLHHARSYDQLAKAKAKDEDKHEDAVVSTGSKAASQTALPVQSDSERGLLKRPARNTLRRRSTLHWATSDPRGRQSKLEAVEADRLVTSWFSIHYEANSDPVYISEVMEHSMNPSFSHFDLDHCLPSVSRSNSFVLRIWAKSELNSTYQLLLDLKLDMRSLQYIGKSLENFHHPLPENCVLLHLSDGIYTSFTDLPADNVQQPQPSAAARLLTPVYEAPFETLLKLANLEEVVQDALNTKARLEADINALLAATSTHERVVSELATRKEAVRAAQNARDAENKTMQQLERAKHERQKSLRSRREILDDYKQQQLRVEDVARQHQEATRRLQQDLRSLDDTWVGQTRRVSTTLLQIFPIDPVKNKPLHFTIRNIYLPNSSFSDTNRDEIAAGLDWVAQVVFTLSLYLSIPLPYSIEIHKPFAYIRDEISAGIAQRQFPLHPTGAAYKFEYGVFLLNKNIEFMLNRNGLRAMDIRHTLPNLKYLMFVLTAGNGELPGRKAGGVPALLRARHYPAYSRRNSDDSFASQSPPAITEEVPTKGHDVAKFSRQPNELPHRSLQTTGFRHTVIKDRA